MKGQQLWVLYHANCYDGFGAAWVEKKFQGLHIEPFFRAMQYGDSLPEIPDGSTVHMLDWSCPRDQILELGKRCRVVVVDHHKTAEANLRDLPEYIATYFDMNKSGARLAWDLFFEGMPAPKLVEYVEDRDLWRFVLPDSRAVSAWLRSYPMDFKTWDVLADKLQNWLPSVVREGEAILRFQTQQVDEVCKHAVWTEIGGCKVPVANSSVFMSEVGERLLQLHKLALFSAYYFDREDGKRQWGLRSRPGEDVDVSEVAKQYGGGGHKHASGFQTMSPEKIGREVTTSPVWDKVFGPKSNLRDDDVTPDVATRRGPR